MSTDPVDQEIQELAAKPELTDAEHMRLSVLLEPTPRRWTWMRGFRWLYRRLKGQDVADV